MSGIDGKTVSLLHFDEDYSLDEIKNFEWSTKYGAPQLNNSIKKFGNSSLYLNGSSALKTYNYSLDFSSGKEFTLEYWAYGSTNAKNTFNNYTSQNNTDLSIAFEFNGTNILMYLSSTGTSWDIFNGVIVGTYTINVFNHMAVVLNNNILTIYINGILKYTKNLTGITIHKSTTGMSIGCAFATYTFNGYIDEFRISNIARYNGNFTPQTTQFEVDANTISLLHFDKLYQAKDIISSNVWAPNGFPQISNDQSRFGKSLFFNGNSYLSIPYSSNFDLSLTDFTIDWWEYRNKSGSENIYSGDTNNILGSVVFGSKSLKNIWLIGAAGAPECNGCSTIYLSSNGTSWDIANHVSMGTLILNQWVHYAVVRKGVNIYLFQNGILINTINVGTKTIYIDTMTDLTIGTRVYNGTYSYSQYFNGYIDEFRISKTARWISNFTLPTLPYSKVRFLAKTSDNHLHAYLNASWNDLGVPSDNTAAINLFKQNEVIDPYDLKTLNKLTTTEIPKICSYQENTAEPILTGKVTAVPKYQFINELNDIELKAMSFLDWIHVNDGISNYETGGGKIRMVISRDSGKTYQSYNVTTSTWDTIIDTTNTSDGAFKDKLFVPTTDCMNRILTSGMDVTTFNSAPWNAFTLDKGYKTLRLGYLLSIDSSTDVALSDTLKYQYDGIGDWMLGTNKIDYTVKTQNSSHTITWLTPADGKRVKINY